MSHDNKIRRVGVPTIMIISTIMTGCAGPADNFPPGFIGPDLAREEYLDEASKWELPGSVRWPQDPGYSSESLGGQPHLYEEGTGRVDATLYWYCAWGDEFLRATHGAPREAALKQLLRLPSTPLYQVGFPAEQKELFDSVSDDLVAGDFTFFAKFVDNTCREVLGESSGP
jgi:hypothetical protein